MSHGPGGFENPPLRRQDGLTAGEGAGSLPRKGGAMTLDAAERARLIEQYATAPKRLRAALAKVPTEAMKWRPEPGEFSVHEIVVHCADSETNAAARIRYLVAEADPVILGYDQAQWVGELRHRRADAKRLIEQIRILREGNLDAVLRVPRRYWKRYGMHNERGRQTVRRNLEMIAGHDLNHLAQIRAIRKKFGW